MKNLMTITGNRKIIKIIYEKFLFRQIYEHVKTIDTTRPVTLVNDLDPDVDHAQQHSDIITINQYSGWYGAMGFLDTVVPDTTGIARRWYEKLNKPIIVTEYGCDTIEGLHAVKIQTGFYNCGFKFTNIRLTPILGQRTIKGNWSVTTLKLSIF